MPVCLSLKETLNDILGEVNIKEMEVEKQIPDVCYIKNHLNLFSMCLSERNSKARIHRSAPDDCLNVNGGNTCGLSELPEYTTLNLHSDR